MVFLTLDANGQTFFFKEPIPNPRFIRLASCSLYNSLQKEALYLTKSEIQPIKSLFDLGTIMSMDS